MDHLQNYEQQTSMTTPSNPMANLPADVAAEVQSVQAQIVVAKQFPRNEGHARNKVLAQCADVNLAERAMYAYKRGGSMISGPSIRLAEAMARAWGNLKFGVQQISQNDLQSEMRAYAWDLESNVVRELRFIVEHVRFTRKDGKKPLHDPRDVYENNMNQAARRLRKCILDLLPGDFVDTAIVECQKTLGNAGDMQKRLNAMIGEFGKLGVTKEMIEDRLQHSLKAIMPAEFVQLRTIFQSIRDGVSSIDEWFTIPHDAKKIVETQKEDSKAKAETNKKTELDAAREAFVKACERATDAKVDFVNELGIKSINEVLLLKDVGKIVAYEDVLNDVIAKAKK